MGYNYRLPNINAALGCAQLELLPRFLEVKRALAKRYRSVLDRIAGVRFIAESEGSKSNYWLITILLNEDLKKNKEQIIKLLHGKKIMVRPAWKLLNKISYLNKFPRMNLSNSVNLFERIINLPSSAGIV